MLKSRPRALVLRYMGRVIVGNGSCLCRGRQHCVCEGGGGGGGGGGEAGNNNALFAHTQYL